MLHYFYDLDEFINVMRSLLKNSEQMICSDFHPFTKIIAVQGVELQSKKYFSKEIFEGEMAHASSFNEEIRKQIPLCSYRKYTISEIINSVIRDGCMVKQFDEHWKNQNVPGEFTLIATTT